MARDLHHLTATLHLADPLQALGAESCHGGEEAPLSLLLPLDPSPRRQLGFLQGCVDEAFFEPLPGEELERRGA